MKKPLQNAQSCKQALQQIREELGATNVCDIHYRSDYKLWWIHFYVGDDQSFESFDDLYTWLKTEGLD